MVADKQALLPSDPSVHDIVEHLSLIKVSGEKGDVFHNKRVLWHPAGARGIYGGTIIAQALVAAQETVTGGFIAHSIHVAFILVARSDIPVKYKVDRVRDSKSFITRNVRGIQEGKIVFTTIVSFARVDASARVLSHGHSMPSCAPPPNGEFLSRGGGLGPDYYPIGITNQGKQHEATQLAWLRAPGPPSSASMSVAANQVALAYISDWNLLSTVAYAHGAMKMPTMSDYTDEVPFTRPDSKLGMMASMDHTLYFHAPLEPQPLDWVLVEAETPWSGAGRGLSMSRIFSREGVMLATCVQEGLLRFKRDLATASTKL